MSHIGERIRALRDIKGWSLAELAERAGVSKGMIGHVETGTRDGSLAMVQKIADALGVSPALLQAPNVELERITKIGEILDKIQDLDDDQVAAVDQMIEALLRSR